MLGTYEKALEVAAADKGLQAAMAIKRWIKEAPIPSTQIGDGGYIASQDIQAALEGDGLEVRTEVNLVREGFPRIQAGVGSVGFDENLTIESVGENRYKITMRKSVAR
ncbi:MAG: hypothetical protein AAB473_02815 [Patescibacteria group bacterium]